MHVLGVALSSLQMADMLTFRSDYARLITSPTGACNGFDMLGETFFTTRLTYAIAMTVVNIITMGVSGYLAWRLAEVSGFSL